MMETVISVKCTSITIQTAYPEHVDDGSMTSYAEGYKWGDETGYAEVFHEFRR